MQCDFCRRDDVTLNLVPFSDDTHTWGCQDCLVKQGLYCERHDCVHIRFLGLLRVGEPDQHACLPCIEDDTAARKDLAPGIYRELFDGLDDEGRKALDEYAATVMAINGDGDISVPVLRAILTAAARLGVNYEQVLTTAIKTRSLREILPG